ncbi:prephenate dehydrogenase/arogenate dehydrogenase family protein [Pseudomonas sp. P66]|jgi:prephenate dehydrogenase|uniref:Prephenate dehydrogenase/arogenate dehydrogenase family protein n=1 Tax=Pseudomonas arcuscaelestis TaxID=2710591 RepID=A0ABS2BWB2_9PSED|nr:prephenate dehydrogenase dimerization domain-containing protein [Pseudomonas arcuscaelestis]MBM3104323.1 prephenate dehydrogenase/arogenate dehydrogenase family protein [Pseudomonas arcuscaelestis]MBM3112644.1 prephenate dehydrogenase/arogenate dehydrogenase family protein [Pseudomonas arcuscaelestis]MBM5457099.1 prephenate dehydrogenase/arogenate dehydrogenase family protein [Pseudomonas arcuscaelestis]
MTNDTVVVLGGGGLVGTLICSVLKQQGLHTRVLDCRAGEHEDEHHQVDVNNPPSDSAQLFSNAIAVVFALPERVAVDAIGWVLQVVSVDVVFIPTCSVQGPFYSALRAQAAQQPFIGINPMFSPKLSVQGRTVAICRDDEGATLSFIETALIAAGMNIRRMTPASHDELMALCQALPHAAIIGFGMALAKSSLDLALIEEVMPPPMRTMLALLSRLLVNPAEVYWGIQQENHQASQQRDALVQGMERLIRIVSDEDYQRFKHDLQTITTALGSRVDRGALDCQRIFSQLN